MTTTPWTIMGTEVGYCDCDYGCPCQFNGLPTSPDGGCRALQFVHIDKGNYGSIRLDGLRFAFTVAWPGPIHEGNGTMQLIIDERANEDQRNAICRIFHNEDTDELLTHYAVFCAMCTTILDPVVAPIELEFDMEKRTAHGEVAGLLVADTEPVRNPVTGEPHRAQIVLPEGFGCTRLETASGTVKATGDVPLDYENTFASFARVYTTDRGIIRD